MKEIIDQKVQRGYALDLGKIIEVSFENFKKTLLMSGITLLIAAVVLTFIYIAYFGILYGFGDFVTTMTELKSDAINPTMQMINAAFGVIMVGVMSPLIAGFINVNHLAKTSQEITINSFFDFYKSPYLKDLILNQIIVGIFTNSIVLFLMLTNHQFISIILQILIPLFMIFNVPLIIYGEQNYLEAIIKSIRLFIKNPFIIFVAFLVGVLGSFVGLIALCIGIIFTLPYYFSIVYAIYDQAIGFKEISVIDEIGVE